MGTVAPSGAVVSRRCMPPLTRRNYASRRSSSLPCARSLPCGGAGRNPIPCDSAGTAALRAPAADAPNFLVVACPTEAGAPAALPGQPGDSATRALVASLCARAPGRRCAPAGRSPLRSRRIACRPSGAAARRTRSPPSSSSCGSPKPLPALTRRLGTVSRRQIRLVAWTTTSTPITTTGRTTAFSRPTRRPGAKIPMPRSLPSSRSISSPT